MKTRLVISACAVALWMLLYAAVTGGLLQGLEERSTDVLWRATASAEPESRVVVVDVDDRSLAQLGPWPWSPSVLAQLVKQLDAQGVGAKLFDVFQQERKGSNEFARRSLSQIHRLPERAASASNIPASPALLAQVFALRAKQPAAWHPVEAISGNNGCHAASAAASGFIGNAAGLHHRAGVSPHLMQTAPSAGCPLWCVIVGAPICTQSCRTFSPGPLGSASGLTVREGGGLTEPAWVLETPHSLGTA